MPAPDLARLFSSFEESKVSFNLIKEKKHSRRKLYYPINCLLCFNALINSTDKTLWDVYTLIIWKTYATFHPNFWIRSSVVDESYTGITFPLKFSKENMPGTCGSSAVELTWSEQFCCQSFSRLPISSFACCSCCSQSGAALCEWPLKTCRISIILP